MRFIFVILLVGRKMFISKNLSTLTFLQPQLLLPTKNSNTTCTFIQSIRNDALILWPRLSQIGITGRKSVNLLQNFGLRTYLSVGGFAKRALHLCHCTIKQPTEPPSSASSTFRSFMQPLETNKVYSSWKFEFLADRWFIIFVDHDRWRRRNSVGRAPG